VNLSKWHANRHDADMRASGYAAPTSLPWKRKPRGC
jgi:hypothetical protein